MKEKSQIDDIDRSVYDIRDEEHDAYRMQEGLTPAIVQKLSDEKGDPAWMQEFRLHALQIYNEMPLPDWGPSIEGRDIDHIATYVRPNTKMQNDWKHVPQDIKDTFERLGIPQAERKSLAGVGAQYDSELVYHNVKDEVAAQGVVYTDMESALTGEYADMVRKYFMKLVTPHDHKFAALHGAVWSGGSFVYVPKGVQVSIPLQSYFRLNAKGAGQFEHTLIIVDEGASLHFIEGCSAPKYNVANLHAGCVELYVKKGAKLRYSTIENWSKNMYNLNTKRALVEEGGTIEWISGSFGSHVGCLYPMSVLKGDNSRMEFTGVTFAGHGQNLDTGAKVVHIGKNTSSYMNTRSISKSGGISTFRSSVVVQKGASGAKSAVSCQSLMLDSESRSDTIPAMDIRTRDAAVGHEAKIGSISNEAVFYLMSRGAPFVYRSELQLHGNMRDAVLEKFRPGLGEAEGGIEGLNVALRLDGDAPRAEMLLRGADGGEDDPAPQPLAAAHGGHAPDGDVRKHRPRGEHACVGGDAALVLQPDMPGRPVGLVDILIGAVLLHDEDRDAQTVDLVQLGRGQLGKMLADQFHTAPHSCVSSTDVPCSRRMRSRSSVRIQTVAVLSFGWTPIRPGGSRNSSSRKNCTLRVSSCSSPSGVTEPGVRCRYCCSSSGEVKLSERVPCARRKALRSTRLSPRTVMR